MCNPPPCGVSPPPPLPNGLFRLLRPGRGANMHNHMGLDRGNYRIYGHGWVLSSVRAHAVGSKIAGTCVELGLLLRSRTFVLKVVESARLADLLRKLLRRKQIFVYSKSSSFFLSRPVPSRVSSFLRPHGPSLGFALSGNSIPTLSTSSNLLLTSGTDCRVILFFFR